MYTYSYFTVKKKLEHVKKREGLSRMLEVGRSDLNQRLNSPRLRGSDLNNS